MDVKKLEAALDELLKDYRKPEEITGPDGLLKQLTKASVKASVSGTVH